jgi:hypothetical protein
MTQLPPDPDPADTPGLEPGGGVQPGDTPPDSGSTTVGLSHHERDTSDAWGPVSIAIVLVVAVMIGGFMLALALGVFD